MERMFAALKCLVGTTPIAFRINAQHMHPTDSYCRPPRRIKRGDIKYSSQMTDRAKTEWLFFGTGPGSESDWLTRTQRHNELFATYRFSRKEPFTNIDNDPVRIHAALRALLTEIGRTDEINSLPFTPAITPVTRVRSAHCVHDEWRVSIEPFAWLRNCDLRVRFNHVPGAQVMRSSAEVFLHERWYQLEIPVTEYNQLFAKFLEEFVDEPVPPCAYFRPAED